MHAASKMIQISVLKHWPASSMLPANAICGPREFHCIDVVNIKNTKYLKEMLKRPNDFSNDLW